MKPNMRILRNFNLVNKKFTRTHCALAQGIAARSIQTQHTHTHTHTHTQHTTRTHHLLHNTHTSPLGVADVLAQGAEAAQPLVQVRAVAADEDRHGRVCNACKKRKHTHTHTHTHIHTHTHTPTQVFEPSF